MKPNRIRQRRFRCFGVKVEELIKGFSAGKFETSYSNGNAYASLTAHTRRDLVLFIFRGDPFGWHKTGRQGTGERNTGTSSWFQDKPGRHQNRRFPLIRDA